MLYKLVSVRVFFKSDLISILTFYILGPVFNNIPLTRVFIFRIRSSSGSTLLRGRYYRGVVTFREQKRHMKPGTTEL